MAKYLVGWKALLEDGSTTTHEDIYKASNLDALMKRLKNEDEAIIQEACFLEEDFDVVEGGVSLDFVKDEDGKTIWQHS